MAMEPIMTLSDDGRSLLVPPSVSFREGPTYYLAGRTTRTLKALLNPVECEYELKLSFGAGNPTKTFRISETRAEEIGNREFPLQWAKADVFSRFYSASSFTVSNLVDLRPREDKHGRTTYVSDGTIQCNHPERTSYMQLFTGHEYDLRDLWLWVIQALERPLDCRYTVVLQSATMPSRTHTITPNTSPELIGLHNWDTITITDIRKDK